MFKIEKASKVFYGTEIKITANGRRHLVGIIHLFFVFILSLFKVDTEKYKSKIIAKSCNKLKLHTITYKNNVNLYVNYQYNIDTYSRD